MVLDSRFRGNDKRQGPLGGAQLCKTKPISAKAQMSASLVLTKDYERIAACGVRKSKAKQSQTKPISIESQNEPELLCRKRVMKNTPQNSET
jgi:hypothetical protein